MNQDGVEDGDFADYEEEKDKKDDNHNGDEEE